MKKSLLFSAIAILIAASAMAAARPSMLQGSHGSSNLLPRTCQSCHRGMNMLNAGEETFCIQCHGSESLRSQAVSKGYLRQGSYSLRDIAAELNKPYRHPVFEVRDVHRSGEVLPEEVLNARRHSECVDCHNPHLVEAGRPHAGLYGRRVGNLMTEIENEYELCFKCHGTSANLPQSSSNKAEEFKTTNPSFHPVLGEGRQTYVISLREPYAARKQRPNDISTISCSDCHGSDAANGPRGPHGSIYQGLLRLNYQTEDNRPESEFAYALCYKCHDRASILGNESFPYHALHILGLGGAGQTGTSCLTCHDAHGSTVNPYLLRFNEDVVRATKENRLEFKQTGYAARHGNCTLVCHGVEHTDRAY